MNVKGFANVSLRKRSIDVEKVRNLGKDAWR